MHEIAATQPSISRAETAVKYNYQNVRNDRMAGSIASYSHSETAGAEAGSSQEEGFSFFDLIDMINPLQHLPIVNIAYRKLTGDEIKPISSIVGGALYGGPVGAASNMIGHVVEDGTGKSPIENVMSLGNRKSDELRAYKDLPPELLSFAEMPLLNNQNYDYNT
ncbi:MAG: hypothetical protein ACTHOO_01335 [Alcanivorax sp.]